MNPRLLISGGRVVTTQGFSQWPQAGGDFGTLVEHASGFVVIEGEIIRLVTGNEAEAIQVAGENAEVIDARGKLVMPGYVDCHTHQAFAGYRDGELGLRLSGASYLDILAAGGGILSTVRHTREASEEKLCQNTLRVLDIMLAHGTTTVEAKSGYGLSTVDELKQLRALQAANRSHAIDVVPTFMGAHALPPEYSERRADYVRLVIDEMLPQVAEEKLAEFCDCFCEAKAFTPDESREILQAAQKLGMGLKLHADEITPLGGAGLAAELGAVSAEHLIYAADEDLPKMAQAGVVAVLLPATAFILRVPEKAPVQSMIKAGVPIAVSTDYNPGTSPMPNMQLLQAFACYHYGLTPAQAFAASTINAAHALKRGASVGSLEAGKLADVILLDAPSLVFVPNHI
ncbi:MAG TPA: imidazolonepropionase, partial [Bacillota bacterium]|nr:imidazolonepropionase [Bacillota bacterium]